MKVSNCNRNRRRLAICTLLISVTLIGCTARHVVTVRQPGEGDRVRGILTSSDKQWKIEQEPTAAANQRR